MKYQQDADDGEGDDGNEGVDLYFCHHVHTYRDAPNIARETSISVGSEATMKALKSG